MNAQKILNLHKIKPETIDENHVKIFYYGTYDENWSLVEQELSKAGLYAIKRTYDKKFNKTTTVYKRVDI